MSERRVRAILVSKEFSDIAEVEAMRGRMPSQEDFHWFAVWNYEADSRPSKAAGWENAMLSLAYVIQYGDGPRGGEGRWTEPGE